MTAPVTDPTFPIVKPRCHDCGAHLEYSPEPAIDGTPREWWAEDDSAGCAGRGDPNAEPAEVLPHRPTMIEGPPGTFMPQRYAPAPFNRDAVTS